MPNNYCTIAELACDDEVAGIQDSYFCLCLTTRRLHLRRMRRRQKWRNCVET